MSSPTLTPSRETVVLHQGDDLDHLAYLDSEVDRLKPNEKAPRAQRTLDEAEQYQAAVEARDAFRAEADERGVKIVLQRIPRKRWKKLLEDNPPREGNQLDAMVGANVADLAEALVPLSIVEPQMSVSETEAFVDDLSDGQHEALFWAAFRANRREPSGPKGTPSAGTPTSGATAS